MDVNEVAELHEIVEDDFEMGYTIKEVLVPHAVSFFTGEMMEEEESDNEEAAEGEDEEEVEEEDEFDSEDEGDDV